MITILGGDQQQIADRLDSLVREFVQSNDSLATSRLSGEGVSLADLQAEFSASSLFHPRRLIVVRDIDRCPGLSSSSAAGPAGTKLIADLLARLNPAHQLIITLNRPAKSSVANWLRRHSDYQELSPLAGSALADWLMARARAAGSQLDRPTADFLIDYYGPEGVGLATEIDKLSLHLTITPDLIRATVLPVLPAAQVFDLTDALVAGQAGRALEVYEVLRAQNSRPEALRGLLGLVIWQIRILLAVKTSQLPSRELATGLGLRSDYPLRKAQVVARRLGRTDLLRLVDSCLATDRQIRVDHRSPADCLPNLIVRAAAICRPG